MTKNIRFLEWPSPLMCWIRNYHWFVCDKGAKNISVSVYESYVSVLFAFPVLFTSESIDTQSYAKIKNAGNDIVFLFVTASAIIDNFLTAFLSTGQWNRKKVMEAEIIINRLFARYDHMLQIILCWDASFAVGLSKQRKNRAGVVQVPLFQKYQYVTCVPAQFIPYHVTRSCKGLIVGKGTRCLTTLPL